MIDKEPIHVDDKSMLQALRILQKRCKQTATCKMCFAWNDEAHNCLVACYPNGYSYLRAIKSLESDIAKEESEHE